MTPAKMENPFRDFFFFLNQAVSLLCVNPAYAEKACVFL